VQKGETSAYKYAAEPVCFASKPFRTEIAPPRTVSPITGDNKAEEGWWQGTLYRLQKGKYKGRVTQMVAIDGSDTYVITNGGVGSKRYRVTFKGPGGHSYGAFGLVNPAFAMGSAIDKFARLTVPRSPKTTFNVGVMGGGTSVNSIPFEGWMELDMRSSDPASLAAVDAKIQQAIDSAVVEENRRWGPAQTITVVKDLIGDRPAGSTLENTAIVRTGLGAATALGFNVNLGEGSTDSNLPMSLHVPAVTIGGGGRGRDAHALTESFDTTDAWMGSQHALLLTLALVNR
jgi:acetylornithine deacetylase/succinyl-diaminopimelate desuccinylase-like protein